MNLEGIKQAVTQNTKNLIGWRTNRKYAVISVDDYGNVRLDSREARLRMDRAGLKVHSRFDAFDALENREDLEMLYEALTSVQDQNGRNAVFSPFAVPCNIDFEKMSETDYQSYIYELLPQTYAKLKGYEGAWEWWKEGIQKGLMAPQFHGREHLNLKVFEEKLARRDPELMTSLRNRSYTSLTSSGYPAVSITAAFDFWDFEEQDRLKAVISEGLDAFEKVFGYRATYFNPPAGGGHSVLYPVLSAGGIRYMDVPMIHREHQGRGHYTTRLHYTGQKTGAGLSLIVRNVVFEPTSDKRRDWVAYALGQMEAAFRWRRPAIISSHRVNFCGHIHPENRRAGIEALKTLLKRMVQRWPDIEFLAAAELGDLIARNGTKV